MDILLNAALSADARSLPSPDHRPRTIAETGVNATVLEDIAVKSLYLYGPFSVFDLSRKMHVGYQVADQLFGRMRAKMMCEVIGMKANDPEIAISTAGRSRALELLAQSQYAGAAPISLESYVHLVREQRTRKTEVHRADVEQAFSNLVFDDEHLTQFGTALNSGEAVFLYGPAGVGKTSTAEALSRALSTSDVWIPFAVEVDGQIISVYDPVIHRPAEGEMEGEWDERWIRCHRPTVVMGGELTMEMLDLQFNPITRYYDGPPQMKANNGVLVIDDFGRQRVQPEDLLNRWVVPLDRKIEFLTMMGGKKIEIPFDILVIFATNRNPATVLDAAFLRRIQTKIKIGAATDEQFSAIFRRVAADRGLAVDEDVLRGLILAIRETLHQELRACHPRDLISQVCWAARYKDEQPRLDHPSLMQALKSYFVTTG